MYAFRVRWLFEHESGSDFREAGSVIFLSESDACLSLNLVGWFWNLVRDTFSIDEVFMLARLIIHLLMMYLTFSHWYIWQATSTHRKPSVCRVVSHHNLCPHPYNGVATAITKSPLKSTYQHVLKPNTLTSIKETLSLTLLGAPAKGWPSCWPYGLTKSSHWFSALADLFFLKVCCFTSQLSICGLLLAAAAS